MESVSLLAAIGRLEDPRAPRGVRHPFASIVALALLGMLARIREMEALVRWAGDHWDELREPLGFTREEPPVAATLSRTLALCTVQDIQGVFLAWLQSCGDEVLSEGVVAVDGKTSKQGIDSNGRPLHMLNAFVHDLQITIGQWSVGEEKSNEPTVLRRRLEELLANYPILKLITGDALFAQRPLAELLTAHGVDYLFQIEADQGDTLDALENCFGSSGLSVLFLNLLGASEFRHFNGGCREPLPPSPSHRPSPCDSWGRCDGEGGRGGPFCRARAEVRSA